MDKLIKSVGIMAMAGIVMISCESEINSSQHNDEAQAPEMITGKKKTVGTSAKSIGKVTVGTDASVWDSNVSMDASAGIYPVGGSGQINGEFSIAERNGIQIGLRIQERFEGPIEASGNRIGIYESVTGISSPTNSNNAEWNYDWHVDLRNAKGRLAGKTLGDYHLILETDIAESIFSAEVPLDLTFGGLDNGVLYQGSWNPGFGNDTFDPSVEGTYNFRLVLTPKSFNGAPLAVKVKVTVEDPV